MRIAVCRKEICRQCGEQIKDLLEKDGGQTATPWAETWSVMVSLLSHSREMECVRKQASLPQPGRSGEILIKEGRDPEIEFLPASVDNSAQVRCRIKVYSARLCLLLEGYESKLDCQA